ncbi:MAG: hypothetical protein JXB13_17300 [Phycisphaerae bacterium]|nr:hypothetical protein [Phycisphaerae bacterium]
MNDARALSRLLANENSVVETTIRTALREHLIGLAMVSEAWESVGTQFDSLAQRLSRQLEATPDLRNHSAMSLLIAARQAAMQAQSLAQAVMRLSHARERLGEAVLDPEGSDVNVRT